MSEFDEIIKNYKDVTEEHEKRWHEFTKKTNSVDFLAKHRDYIESGPKGNPPIVLGHGDRAFQYFWYLLFQQVPDDFKFLEVGVYKAQILSLCKLISNHFNKSPEIVGVTILNDVDFTSYNRMPYIEKIFQTFNLDMNNTTVIDGSSHSSKIRKQAEECGPYDVLYIDGDHSYMGARCDVEDYEPMLKPGGYFIMDDASCNLKMRTREQSGIFPGIPEVSDALRDTIEKYDNYTELFSCGHLRLFKKEK